MTRVNAPHPEKAASKKKGFPSLKIHECNSSESRSKRRAAALGRDHPNNVPLGGSTQNLPVVLL